MTSAETICSALGLRTAEVLAAPSPDEIRSRRLQAQVRKETKVDMPSSLQLDNGEMVHLYQVVREPTDNPLSDSEYQELVVHDLRDGEIRVASPDFSHDYRVSVDEFAERFTPVTRDDTPVFGYPQAEGPSFRHDEWILEDT